MDTASGQCVLVVEDNEDLRSLVILLLESKGYRVIGADDGEAALRALHAEQGRVIVVVLDLRMPRLDGPAFLRLKADDPALSSIPVIVTSATPEDLHWLLSDSVKAVLTKPVEIPELLAHVDHWFKWDGRSTRR